MLSSALIACCSSSAAESTPKINLVNFFSSFCFQVEKLLDIANLLTVLVDETRFSYLTLKIFDEP